MARDIFESIRCAPAQDILAAFERIVGTEVPLCEVSDCWEPAVPCECGAAHCADHPHES